ncbi:MAG: nuclear transport factor 2 family protein [Candidatus Binatia bacterium]
MPLSGDDWSAIANTLARYCHTVDFGDARGWAECFTEDGLFEESMFDRGVVTRLRGRKEMEDFVAAAHRLMPHVVFARHNVSNQLIEGDGDRATAVSFVTFINTFDGSAIVTAVYRDRLRKVGGRWLFEHREAAIDQTEAIAAARMNKLAADAAAAGKPHASGVGAFSSGK